MAKKKKAAKKSKSKFEFEGVSATAHFQQALDDALAQLDQALVESGISDAMGKWELRSVNGERGGIAGLKTVKVVIRAKI